VLHWHWLLGALPSALGLLASTPCQTIECSCEPARAVAPQDARQRWCWLWRRWCSWLGTPSQLQHHLGFCGRSLVQPSGKSRHFLEPAICGSLVVMALNHLQCRYQVCIQASAAMLLRSSMTQRMHSTTTTNLSLALHVSPLLELSSTHICCVEARPNNRSSRTAPAERHDRSDEHQNAS